MSEGMDFSAVTAQLGLTNALRTGNVIIDMLMCMLIPLFFGGIATLFGELRPLFHSVTARVKRVGKVTRTIRVSKHYNSWGYCTNSDSSTRDSILQKAIMLYVAKHCTNTWHTGAVTLTAQSKAKQNAAEELSGDLTTNSTAHSSYDSDEEIDSDDGCREHKVLKSLEVSTMPPDDAWIEIVPGVHLIRSHTVDEGDNKTSGRSETTVINLNARGPAAAARISKVVERAFAWYKEQQLKIASKQRYMLMMLHHGGGGGQGGDGGGDEKGKPTRHVYKRYCLSEEKTFDSLFFPDKPLLLRLLDHFTNKTGKFAIPGFPHKLGLLLHGPPGTGKTSLIKAIAQHTGRHIVSVPLSKVKTNQELMDVMFDLAFKVFDPCASEEGSDTPAMQVPFSKIIFVMEDVDAASRVVRHRGKSGGEKGKCVTTTTKRIQRHHVEPKLITRARSASAADQKDSKDIIAVDLDLDKTKLEPNGPERKNKSLPVGQSPPQVQGAADPAAAEDGEVEEVIEEETVSTLASSASSSKKGELVSYLCEPHVDKLDLAGVLNVLDGVVDSPGRVVIMTTNHPESLDPALTRPGRINKKILMGYLGFEDALKMVEHYFGRLEPALMLRFSESFLENVFTPAQVEQLCAEHDSVPDFLKGLLTLEPNAY